MTGRSFTNGSWEGKIGLHWFPILGPIWNPSCPDLKSLPGFVTFLPQFEMSTAALFCNPSCPDLQSLKPAPNCNLLIAPFCNPEKFFPLFRFFPFWYWNLNILLLLLWPKFDETWFETPSVWDAFNIIIWYCFGIEIWTWITLALVPQFWWNFAHETFGMIAKKWPY